MILPPRIGLVILFDVFLSPHQTTGGRSKELGIFTDLKEFEKATVSDEAKKTAFGGVLTVSAKRYYGSAIREFLDGIMEDSAGNLDIVNRHIKIFVEKHVPKAASAVVQHVAQGFALKYAVGQLPIVRTITGWPADEAAKAIVFVFELWLKELGNTGVSRMELGKQQLRGFLAAHPEFRSQWRKKAVFVIGLNEFQDVACFGFDYELILRALRDDGFLVSDPKRYGECRAAGAAARTRRVPDARALHYMSEAAAT
jgi:hypothetical protein